ncbi:MCE family protein [Rhodococcus spelaei]|uniref:MCE family protein n=1 Tax=Rhodococcus spelaei TaxID=2546320 RepID=A0A541B919_9NOCA|nr:MCE family protein [Rhodococcus spelaei]TQF68814.1 MCE family protein [Rhodococcus spelaei]
MRRLVVVQLILFALTSAIVIPFGINYVLGPQAFGDPIRVHSQMADALGLTAGTSVTYRGVTVGKVASVSLAPDVGGARVDFDLDPGTRIPRDSVARVGMGTAAGIQNVDIFPNTGEGPFLGNGDELAAPADKQPVQMSQMMLQASRLVDGIDPTAVSDLGTELGASFDGLGPAIAGIIDNGDTLSAQLSAQTPMLKSLLDRTASLVSAMAGQSDSFVRGTSAARNFTEQLDTSAPVLVYLADTSPQALGNAQQLFDRYHDTFGALLANLVTVEPIISDRTGALASGLTDIPKGLGRLGSIVTGDRANFTLVATQGPVCNYDTVRRAVGDVSPATTFPEASPATQPTFPEASPATPPTFPEASPATPPNLTYYCPPGKNIAQRGARNAPRPNDLGLQNATTPGTVIGPPVVDDPILVPTGVEALNYWKKLLEDLGHGK